MLALVDKKTAVSQFLDCKHLTILPKEESLETHICFSTMEGYIVKKDRYGAALVYQKNQLDEPYWDDNSGDLHGLEEI